MKLRKLTAILMALVMIFALSATAFATENTGNTVTVKFTQYCSETEDGIYSWTPGSGYDLFDTNSTVLVNTETLNGISLSSCKAEYYLPSDHQMRNTVSVLDVVIAALKENNHSIVAGWDAYPEDGLPGGYIYNIDDQEFEFYAEPNGDGTYWMMGTGFVIGIANDANSAPVFSDTYLSNVSASTLGPNAVIYVDLGFYTFSSVEW